MLGRCDSCRRLSKMVKTNRHYGSDHGNTQRTLTRKHQEWKHDKKKNDPYEKTFKKWQCWKWSGPTIDYWLCSSHQNFFSHDKFSESRSKMIPRTTVLSSILWVESLNWNNLGWHIHFVSFMLPVIHAGNFFCAFSLWGHTVWGWKRWYFLAKESLFPKPPTVGVPRAWWKELH